MVEEALEESSENGLWRRRRAEVEVHVRRRVPEFQVIVALVQKYAPSRPVGEMDSAKLLVEPSSHAITRNPMLAEVALRVMWLYHRSFPELVAETRFEVGKLLHYVTSPLAETLTSSNKGMNLLSQLHVLRLLKESDQFVWSSKSGAVCMVAPGELMTLTPI